MKTCMGGDYGYDGALNRGIAVSTAAAPEALAKVYRAKAFENELEGLR